MMEKEIDGRTYKAVKVVTDNCEGCAGDGGDASKLCMALGLECMMSKNKNMIWVLRSE